MWLALRTYAPTCQGLRVAIVFTVAPADVIGQRGDNKNNIQSILNPYTLKPVGVVFQNASRYGDVSLSSQSHLIRKFDAGRQGATNVARQRIVGSDAKTGVTTLTPLGSKGDLLHLGNAAHLVDKEFMDHLKLSLLILVGPFHSVDTETRF